MIDPEVTENQQTQQVWRAEYIRQLDQRLDLTLSYLSNAPTAKIHTHINSFGTLLNETHRFPELTQKALALISRLHPLPLRWGLGHLWEVELQFALDHISSHHTDQAAEYLCSLGEVYRFRGQFDLAIGKAETALAMSNVSLTQAARAGWILFNCYRANGQPQKADEAIGQVGTRFHHIQAAADVPAHAAHAWLKLQQCWLELLRERGEVDRALELVQEMIWLEKREGESDKTLTADLYTHRSTLLWARSRYPEAVSDLKIAMQLFKEADDPFNAETLKSNLGLVYWTMGALDLAEKTLLESIRFYRETSSEQLLTYDIANLGLVYFARGELDAALNLTQEHIALAQKINFVHEYHRGRRNLGTILYYFGEYERSIAETTASHAYYRNRGSRDAYGLDVLWLALCYHESGEPEKALDMAQETLTMAKALASRVLEQVTLRCLAAFLPREEREAPLLRSLTLAREMERTLEEAAVRLALAGLYNDSRREQEWQAGSAILAAAGAGAWLADRSPDNPPFLPLLL
jgi:tetratricopeptide (TPR) repeat protein